MLVFSAFCPHTPLVVPTVGKENIDKLQNTIDAYSEIEQAFQKAEPECVIIISPHGDSYDDAFSINFCDTYHGDFEEFGDFSTKLELRSDYLLIDRIQRLMRDEHAAITLDSCEKLDHGAVVPLFMLAKNIKDIRLVPLNPSGLDLKKHFDFGQTLKEIILDTNKRVAVIASGDLSHSLTTEAPAGFNEHGKEFDESFRSLLANDNMAGLQTLNKTMVEGAHECGLKPMVILSGILHGMEYEPNILSYEAPFGVGYLTCIFKMI